MIPLLFNFGTAYSATSPLWRTLQDDTKYLHTGHRKKTHWLWIIRNQYNDSKDIAKTKKKFLLTPEYSVQSSAKSHIKFTKEYYPNHKGFTKELILSQSYTIY